MSYIKLKMIMMLILMNVIISCNIPEVKNFEPQDMLELNSTILEKSLIEKGNKLSSDSIRKGDVLLIIKDDVKEHSQDKDGNIKKDDKKRPYSIRKSSGVNDKNRGSKKSMEMTDGTVDTFGGKMICSKDSILFRISRSRFIDCIQKYKSTNFKYWLENYSVMNLDELSLINHGKITMKCKKHNIIAYLNRTNLISCMRISYSKGRFIYRNPSSMLIRLKFKEVK